MQKFDNKEVCQRAGARFIGLSQKRISFIG